jgi:hypothetical protein
MCRSGVPSKEPGVAECLLQQAVFVIRLAMTRLRPSMQADPTEARDWGVCPRHVLLYIPLYNTVLYMYMQLCSC